MSLGVLDATASIWEKIGFILLFIFMFFFILGLLDEAVNILPDLDVLKSLIELMYMIGSGLMLLVNILFIVFKDQGFETWIFNLFEWLIRVLAYSGNLLGDIIGGIILAFSSIIGWLVSIILAQDDGLVCFGSCNPIPLITEDLAKNSTVNSTNLLVSTLEWDLRFDGWLYLDFDTLEFSLGMRFRYFLDARNSVVEARGLIDHYITLTDNIFVAGLISISRLGGSIEWAWNPNDTSAKIRIPRGYLGFFIIDSLDEWTNGILNSLPTFEEMFTDFFEFNTVEQSEAEDNKTFCWFGCRK